MTPPFDIFKLEKGGTLTWKGTAENLEVANLSVAVLMETAPAEYVIHNVRTGHKTVIKLDGSTDADSTSGAI